MGEIEFDSVKDNNGSQSRHNRDKASNALSCLKIVKLFLFKLNFIEYINQVLIRNSQKSFYYIFFINYQDSCTVKYKY